MPLIIPFWDIKKFNSIPKQELVYKTSLIMSLISLSLLSSSSVALRSSTSLFFLSLTASREVRRYLLATYSSRENRKWPPLFKPLISCVTLYGSSFLPVFSLQQISPRHTLFVFAKTLIFSCFFKAQPSFNLDVPLPCSASQGIETCVVGYWDHSLWNYTTTSPDLGGWHSGCSCNLPKWNGDQESFVMRSFWYSHP